MTNIIVGLKKISGPEFVRKIRSGERDFKKIKVVGLNARKNLDGKFVRSYPLEDESRHSLSTWPMQILINNYLCYDKISDGNFQDNPYNFSESILSGSIFSSGLHIPYIIARNSRFVGSDLSGSNFYRGDFSGSDFSRTDLSQSHVCGALFNNCNFQDTNFQYSNLRSVSFHNSNLKGAIFDQAFIANVNFNGTILEYKKKK